MVNLVSNTSRVQIGSNYPLHNIECALHLQPCLGCGPCLCGVKLLVKERKRVSSKTAMFVAIPRWEQCNLIHKRIRLKLLELVEAKFLHFLLKGYSSFLSLYVTILYPNLQFGWFAFWIILVNKVVDAFIS